MQDELSLAQRKVVGTKQTLKALENGETGLVYIAEDAEAKVVRPVLSLCEEKGIEVRRVETMIELGKMCGIKVKAASAAIIENQKEVD